MEVYEFDKCLLTRLQESKDVLGFKEDPVPASHVRSEWSYFVEVQIEPTGWQALWKIPRVICEELNIRYPTIVFGNVEQVIFKELKAIFTVSYVEDDDVQIPEEHEVALEELWPTIKQENSEINIEKTADCIDKLRFFYNNIWMPWDKDNDDDLDWAEKHLESRIRFFYDLKRKDMKRSLAAHVRSLLVEARYIQKRREYLEMDISDDEELDDTIHKNQITDLMRLHLRLARIKSEMEMFENPEIRKIYEDIEFDDMNNILRYSKRQKHDPENDKFNVFIVTKPNTLTQHIALFDLARKFITDERTIQISPSLQSALETSNPSDKVFLPPGKHSLKFLEYLNDDGLICGLSTDTKYSLFDKINSAPNNSDVIIISEDDDSTLLVLDGNFTLENLIFDCRNVRSGIIIKNGNVRLRNCRVIGDGISSTREGITVSGNSKLILENCLVQNFATGIILTNNAKALLDSTTIHECHIGIETEDGVIIEFRDGKISNSKKCGVLFQTTALNNNNIEKKKIIGENLNELQQYFFESLPLQGDCSFEKNEIGNFVVFNRSLMNLSSEMKDTSDIDY